MARHDPRAMLRVRVSYNLAWSSHVLNLHMAPNTDATTALANTNAVLNQLKQMIGTDESFFGADIIPALSNIGNPLAGFAAIAGTGNPANRQVSAAAGVAVFIGRTVAGTRARLFLFTDSLGIDRNYRLEAGEWAPLASIIAWLNSTSSPLLALDGLAPVWKNYVDYAPHKHWVRKLRKGAG